MTEDVKPQVEGKTRRSTFALVLATVMVDQIGFGIIFPIIPFLTRTLGGDAASLGILVASFSVMQFIFSPILGKLSDRIGRRPVLLVCLAGSTVGNLIFALSDSLLLLLAGRIIAGIGGAKISVAQAYIADLTERRERTKWMGRVGAALGSGFFIGPTIGGLASLYGVSTVGYVAAALSFANLLLASVLLPESLQQSIRSNVKAFAAQKVGFLDALKRPNVGVLLVTFIMINFSFSAIPVIYPMIGIRVFNMNPTEMSFVFTYVGIVQIIVQGFLVGRASRWIGEEKLLVVGAFMLTATLFTIPFSNHVNIFLAVTSFLPIGMAIASPLIPAMISRRSSPGEQGIILGVAQSLGSLARVPGPLLGGFLFELLGPGSPFFTASALMAVGFVLTLKVLTTSRSRNPETPTS